MVLLLIAGLVVAGIFGSAFLVNALKPEPEPTMIQQITPLIIGIIVIVSIIFIILLLRRR